MGNTSGAVSAVQVSAPKTPILNPNLTLRDHEGVALSPESSDDSSITPEHGRTTWHGGVGNAGDTSTSTSSSDIISSGMATTDRLRHRHHPYNKPGLDPYLTGRNRNPMASSMSLDDTSSDDSTYSSQHQSDANSTPRTGTSQTLPRNLPRQTLVQHNAGMGLSNVKVKSMSDYEAEILQMRSEMEHLQIKLSEAERRLQFSSSNSSNESSPSKSTITTAEQDQSKFSNSDQDMAKEVVQRLTREEEKLRNDQLGAGASALAPSDTNEPITDKERRILEELNKISSTGPVGSSTSSSNAVGGSSAIASGAKVSVTTSPINVTSINTSSNTVSHDRRVSSSSTSSNKSITVITNGEATCCTTSTSATSPSPTNVKSSNSNSLPAQPAGSQEIPKRVEELLDSLHSTPI